MEDDIKKSYEDILLFQDKLISMNDLSTWTNFEPIFRKNLLLSCASYYEFFVYKNIERIYKSLSKSKKHLCEFTVNSLNRRYHTLFDWDNKNTNSFLRMFGEEKKNQVRKIIDSSEDILEGEKLFLEIGNKRNILVHTNYCNATVNISLSDIYSHHISIIKFLNFLFSEIDK
jgi:hypothetical protein